MALSEEQAARRGAEAQVAELQARLEVETRRADKLQAKPAAADDTAAEIAEAAAAGASAAATYAKIMAQRTTVQQLQKEKAAADEAAAAAAEVEAEMQHALLQIALRTTQRAELDALKQAHASAAQKAAELDTVCGELSERLRCAQRDVARTVLSAKQQKQLLAARMADAEALRVQAARKQARLEAEHAAEMETLEACVCEPDVSPSTQHELQLLSEELAKARKQLARAAREGQQMARTTLLDGAVPDAAPAAGEPRTAPRPLHPDNPDALEFSMHQLRSLQAVSGLPPNGVQVQLLDHAQQEAKRGNGAAAIALHVFLEHHTSKPKLPDGFTWAKKAVDQMAAGLWHMGTQAEFHTWRDKLKADLKSYPSDDKMELFARICGFKSDGAADCAAAAAE